MTFGYNEADTRAKGFSSQNLWYMRQLYLEYREIPKLQPLVGEISWSKNLIVMARCKDPLEREFYKYALRVANKPIGVAMLSGILNSGRAIEVNIAIMRTFVKLHRMLENHETLAGKLAEIEKKYDDQFRVVFEVLDELMTPPEPNRKQISFSVKERRAVYRTGRKKGART